jgi:hypothetical protein
VVFGRDAKIGVTIIDKSKVGEVNTKKGETGRDSSLESLTILGKVTLRVSGSVNGLPKRLVFGREMIPGFSETHDAGGVEGRADGHEGIIII